MKLANDSVPYSSLKQSQIAKEPSNNRTSSRSQLSARGSNPYGSKIRIRSSSSNHKYQMYDPKNMPYRKNENMKSLKSVTSDYSNSDCSTKQIPKGLKVKKLKKNRSKLSLK